MIFVLIRYLQKLLPSPACLVAMVLAMILAEAFCAHAGLHNSPAANNKDAGLYLQANTQINPQANITERPLTGKQLAAMPTLVPLPDKASSSSNGTQALTTQALTMVPLKNMRNALMVDAELSHQSSSPVVGTFILDTGATYTSISREMAEALGIDLKNTATVLITTANGRIQVPKITLDRIRVNGLEAHNVEVTVIDVHKNASFSGLLGLSFIRQFKLTIDPQEGHLVFQAI